MLSIAAFTSLAIWMLQNGICTFKSVGQVKMEIFYSSLIEMKTLLAKPSATFDLNIN
jgi:hypothetical protein